MMKNNKLKKIMVNAKIIQENLSHFQTRSIIQKFLGL